MKSVTQPQRFSFWSVAAVLVAVICLGIAPERVAAGVLAHWSFNEAGGATVAADSVGSNDGALAGDAAFVTGGIEGNALSVTETGAGLVNMGDIFGFTSGDFSIAVWVKTAQGYNSPHSFFVGKHRSGFVAGYFAAMNTSSTYGQLDKAWFYDSDGSPGDEPRSTTTVNDGLWHQVVTVYDEDGLSQIYVDGGSVEDSRTSIPIGAVTAPFLIGGISVGTTPAATFTGLVDDVQLYDQALTSDQVQQLFDSPGARLPEPGALAALIGVGGLLLGRNRNPRRA